MKALLYKDFILLIKGNWSFLIFGAVITLLSFRVMAVSLAPAIGILLLFFTLVVPADLDARWLDPLPLSPKVRVWSKYLLLWALEVGCFLLVLLLSLLSPSAEATREVLVTFLVYWTITLFLQAVFFPILAMSGPENKAAFTTFFVCCFVGYVIGIIPIGLERETPLTVPDMLPFLLIAFAAAVISAPFAVSQYRKAW